MNILLYLLCIACLLPLHANQQGVILKPCIDLVGQPLKASGLSYNNLPHAGGRKRPFDACPRMHQLLYNEIVEIIKQDQDELHIRVPNIFYITAQHKTPQSSFWTHKDNIVLLDTLDDKVKAHIPVPIDYKKPNQNLAHTITLAHPWQSKACACTFSVGTRFICKPIKKGAQKVVAYAAHPHTQQLVTMAIPIAHCIIHNENNPDQIHSRYTKLLKEWAQTPGTIAYVWGGSSLVLSNHTDHYKETAVTVREKQSSIYEYINTAEQYKTGFDCSGLIMRAAQTAGLPYYFRNTTTLATYLKPVAQAQDLKEGDLIWIPWHVMAIGDLKENTIIEARHYNHGYGKLHEIQINKVFKDIDTFTDLFNAIAQDKPLHRLNRQGESIEIIRQAKILAIDSCWNQSYT